VIRRLVTLGRGRTLDRAREHALREARLEHVRDAVEQFTYALGLLIAGHDPPPEMADHGLATQMQRELRPFLARGDVMRPDFGAFGDLRIEGNLLNALDPLLATLEFEDRCVRQTARGRLVPARHRRLRLTMRVCLEPLQVTECVVSEVVARNA
jgi:hypothetical protein